MVAIVNTKSNSATKPAARPANPWRLVGEFETVERAQAAISQLRRAGQQAALSMVGGLSVLVRQ